MNISYYLKNRKSFVAVAAVGVVISLQSVKATSNQLTDNEVSPHPTTVTYRLSDTDTYRLSDTTIIRLEGVDVHANRNQAFTRTGRVVEVVDASLIRKLPVESPDALLRSLPGVDIRQRGMGATQADISIRGGSFDQVLVLVNGINVTDPQTGHHNLNLPIDLNELKSVEVLQGAASRRYGSQAFSGAVNFITGPADKNNLKLAFTSGAFGTHSQQLSYSTGKKLRNYTSISHHSSDGHRINTDYQVLNVFNRTTWTTRTAGSFDLQLSSQRKSFGANGFYGLAYPNQFEHTRTRLGSLSWEKQLNQLNLQASAYQRRHYDRFELYRNFENAPAGYTDHNYHSTRVSGMILNGRLDTKAGVITTGLDIRNDRIVSTRLGEPITGKLPRNTDELKPKMHYTHEAQRALTNGYVGYAGSIHNLFVSGGLALSYNRDFGMQHHYGADLSYLFTNELSAFVSANSASRLPTFTDLYYQDPIRKANPNLQPETAHTYEGGVAFRQGKFESKAGFFIRFGQNIIDWIKYPDQNFWISENLTALTTQGLYAGMSYVPAEGPFTYLSTSYQLMQLDKEADGFDSRYALDYLKHQFTGTVQHRIVKKVDASWTVLIKDRAGDYTDFETGTPEPYRAYCLLSSRVSWNLKRTQLYVDFNNLLNVRYVDFGGLPMPGFHLLAGIKWQLRK